MKASYNVQARKRAVNLTLNEDLVEQARGITDNLSGVVETLLADYVQAERDRHMAKAEALEATIATWNNFTDKHGSFADEYSTL
jgi:post-segregation antitoxin (ccd killing protein)